MYWLRRKSIAFDFFRLGIVVCPWYPWFPHFTIHINSSKFQMYGEFACPAATSFSCPSWEGWRLQLCVSLNGLALGQGQLAVHPEKIRKENRRFQCLRGTDGAKEFHQKIYTAPLKLDSPQSQPLQRSQTAGPVRAPKNRPLKRVREYTKQGRSQMQWAFFNEAVRYHTSISFQTWVMFSGYIGHNLFIIWDCDLQAVFPLFI